MLITHTKMRSLYQEFTKDDDAANLTFGTDMMNAGVQKMLGTRDWPFLEATVTRTTTASTQRYSRAADDAKIIAAKLTIGSYDYPLRHVSDTKRWNNLDSSSTTSDIATHYRVFGRSIDLFPTPSASSNTITIDYKKRVVALSLADYSTGTISAIANGATTVTGAGTTWTSNVYAGMYLRIDVPDGDGIYYLIDSVTDNTTLELAVPYQGVTIAAGSASYLAGEVSVLPSEFQMAPVHYAAHMYYLTNDLPARSEYHKGEFNEQMTQMWSAYSSETTDVVMDTEPMEIINPNLYPTNVS